MKITLSICKICILKQSKKQCGVSNTSELDSTICLTICPNVLHSFSRWATSRDQPRGPARAPVSATASRPAVHSKSTMTVIDTLQYSVFTAGVEMSWFVSFNRLHCSAELLYSAAHPLRPVLLWQHRLCTGCLWLQSVDTPLSVWRSRLPSSQPATPYPPSPCTGTPGTVQCPGDRSSHSTSYEVQTTIASGGKV